MADIAITAASVVKVTGATVENGTFGETIVAGDWVYTDPATGKFKKTDANDSGMAVARGMALNGGALDQPATILLGGDVNVGAVLSQGKVYVLSGTAGKMFPVDDVTAAGAIFVTIVGVAVSSTVLRVLIVRSDATAVADVT